MIIPSSNRSVIRNMRWSSSITTFSKGMLKNGLEWHPGSLCQSLLNFLASWGVWKWLQEWVMLHLKINWGFVGCCIQFKILVWRFSFLSVACNIQTTTTFECCNFDLNSVVLNSPLSQTVLSSCLFSYLSFLWILHQIQLLFEVAPFMPIAIRKNCQKRNTL